MDKPRRRIVATIEIEADTEKDLIGHLYNIGYTWERDGISASSVSGGYSSGHIITVNTDNAITHESWEKALNEYLDDDRRRG